MKKYNYIYIITNKINGKIYIGKHSTDNLNDNYMGSGKLIFKAILKYGIENFTKDYLAFCDNEETLNYLEKFYIKKYKAREVGYNLTDGGDGMVGFHHSKETLLKLSATHKGENNSMYGKHHKAETIEKLRKPKTEEHKKKLSEATKKQIKENGHPLKGKHQSEESKYKSSIAPGHRSLETREKLKEAWKLRKIKMGLI